jgi:hypothetical protein
MTLGHIVGKRNLFLKGKNGIDHKMSFFQIRLFCCQSFLNRLPHNVLKLVGHFVPGVGFNRNVAMAAHSRNVPSVNINQKLKLHFWILKDRLHKA